MILLYMYLHHKDEPQIKPGALNAVQQSPSVDGSAYLHMYDLGYYTRKVAYWHCRVFLNTTEIVGDTPLILAL